MIDVDFSNKTVLVTGGSSGIGNGIARVFREHGARVHVTGTRADAGAYDGTDLEDIVYHRLDFADEAAIEAFDPGIEGLDVLVNSVGTVLYKRGEFEMAGFRKVLEVNLIGVFHCCMKFEKRLIASKGSVVNIGSVACFNAVRGNPAYSASKGGLLTLTKSLAQLWARHGVRVNGVAPGFVRTKLTEAQHANRETYEASLRAIPLGRWGEPEEMGGAVLFLASPLASYVTGQMILVDGGVTLS